MRLTPQARTVLAHMRREPNITPWAAEGVYRIRRLASRIDELIGHGYDIRKATAEDATGQRYTRYSLTLLQRTQDGPVHPPRPRRPRVSLESIRSAMQDRNFCAHCIDSVIDRLREVHA